MTLLSRFVVDPIKDFLRLDIARAAPIQEAAQAATARGELALAIRLYDRAMHLTPDNPALYFLRGSALLEYNQPEKALEDFVAGLKLDPGNQTLTFLKITTSVKIAERAAAEHEAQAPERTG